MQLYTRAGYQTLSPLHTAAEPYLETQAMSSTSNRTTLSITGMTCGHCVMSVKRALGELEGVTVEQVAIGSATVQYDPAVVQPSAIADAVSDAGYTASIN